MKRMTLNRFLVLAGVVLAVNIAQADENHNTMAATNSMGLPLTGQQFVTDASMAGMKEVYVSQLALEKSGNSDVKDFANAMIKDHTAAAAKLDKVVQKGGYTCPATNTFSATDPTWNSPLLTDIDNMKGQEARMLIATNVPNLSDYRDVRELKTLNGDQFDHAYLSVMTADHVAAVSEFESAANTLSDPNLKKFAQKTLPTLRHHYEMVRELDNKYGVPAENAPTPSNASTGQPSGSSAMNNIPMVP